MPTQRVNGVEYSYIDSGHGPVLALLHGFPLDSRVWHAITDHLQTHFRIIAPDLRGFGQTASKTPFTIESLADDVHAFLAALGTGPCILGGLSMGGYVAQAFAKKYAQSLRGLALIDTKSAADTPEGKQARMQMIESARSGGSKAVADLMFPKMLSDKTVQQQPPVVRALQQIMLDCPPLTIEHALLAMRDREDYTPLLPKLKVPTLVVVGESDAIASVDVARAMAAAAPGSKLAIIPGAGHMAPMEQPQAVAEAIQGNFNG